MIVVVMVVLEMRGIDDGGSKGYGCIRLIFFLCFLSHSILQPFRLNFPLLQGITHFLLLKDFSSSDSDV